MNFKILSVLILAIVLVGVVDKTNGLTCKLVGRIGCYASCLVQNCATGYCRSDDVCVCSRCGTGTPGGFGKLKAQGESIQKRGLILSTFICTY